MQVDKNDKIIRSAAIVGTRRIGKPDEDKKYNEKRSSGRSDAVGAQAKGALATSDSDQIFLQKPVEDDVLLSDFSSGSETDWRENLIASLKQEVESLSTENGQLKHDVEQWKEQALKFKEGLDAERATAAETGREEGFQHGMEQAREQFQQQLTDLQQLMDLLKTAADTQWQKVESFAVEIGMSGLLKLIAGNLGTVEFTRSLITEAVNKVRHEHKLTARLSPADYKLMEKHFNDLQQQLSPAGLEFVADARVELGGCILESERGSWDARLETQIQRLKDSLSPLVGQES